MNHATSSRQERSFWIRFSVKFNIFSYYSIIQGSVCLSRRKIDTSTLFAKCTHTSDTSSLRHRNSFPFSRFLIEYIQNPNQWIISISSYIDICSSFNICFFRFSGFCVPNHPISVFWNLRCISIFTFVTFIALVTLVTLISLITFLSFRTNTGVFSINNPVLCCRINLNLCTCCAIGTTYDRIAFTIVKSNFKSISNCLYSGYPFAFFHKIL